jgi:rhodanese-related sulfurtransferase
MTNNPDNAQAKAAQDKVKEIQGDAKETTQAAQDKAQDLKGKAQETAQTAGGKTQEAAQAATSKAQETAEAAKNKVQSDVQTAKEKAPDVTGGIQAAKDRIPNITPTPPGLKAQSSAQDLKARLEGGEPGLTIVDIRDRDTYNEGHIMGAIPMPMNELVERAQSSLEANRDIYVYGKTDQETAQAANSLRQAGFVNVAELKGGLDGWKAIGGSTEGRAEAQAEPGSQAYNVVSQVTDQMKKQ